MGISASFITVQLPCRRTSMVVATASAAADTELFAMYLCGGQTIPELTVCLLSFSSLTLSSISYFRWTNVYRLYLILTVTVQVCAPHLAVPLWQCRQLINTYISTLPGLLWTVHYMGAKEELSPRHLTDFCSVTDKYLFLPLHCRTVRADTIPLLHISM